MQMYYSEYFDFIPDLYCLFKSIKSMGRCVDIKPKSQLQVEGKPAPKTPFTINIS
jgi:hypothetical protein